MNLDEDYYKTICRVCLSCSEEKNMVSLVDSEENGELTCYGVAVTTFANIVIQSDSLPHKMCQRCLFLLKQAITFKKTCESSDATLMRLVQNVHHSDAQTREIITQYVMFSNYFADPASSNSHESEKNRNNLSKSNECSKESKKVIKSEDVFIEITREDSDCGVSSEDDSSSINNLDTFQDKQVIANQKKNKCSDLRPEEIKEDILLDEMENMLKLDRRFINSKLKRYPMKPKPKPSIQQHSVLIRKKKKKIKKQCEICNKVLANIQTYRQHKRSHTGKIFICEQCGKSFATHEILQAHLARLHNVGRFFECKQCSYKAFRKWDLEEHERVHTGEMPFACEKCGRTFRRQYLWKKHMTYHKEKSVQCPRCPRKFHLQGEMHAHYNNIHERWYVYACHVCDLTYAKTATVRRHLIDKHGIAREKQGRIKRVVLGSMPSE